MVETGEGNIDIYIEKYCRLYGYTPEEAEEHAMVREVKAYYDKASQTGGK